MRTWQEIIEIEMMDCDHRDIEKLIENPLVEWAMRLYAKEVVEDMEERMWEFVDPRDCPGGWDYTEEYKDWKQKL
jgi:hypothetical protein